MRTKKALLLLSFSSLVAVWSPGVLGALTSQAEGPQDCARWIQNALEVPLAGVGSHRSADHPNTDSGSSYLALVNIGLLSLGPETPALVEALKQAINSPLPINPFLNLRSSLAKALADRVEPLVAQVQPAWPSILDWIKVQVSETQAEQDKRDSDQRSTRRVVGLVPVPNDVPQDFSNGLADLEYVGQTDEFLIFAKYSRMREQSAIYRVSKTAPRLQLIARVHLPEKSQERVSRWVRNGSIFGIGVFDAGVQSEKSRFHPRLFRLDPQTAEFQWAEPWDDERHIFRRVQSTDTVVGFQLDKVNGTKGRIFRFDENSLKFIPTKLGYITDDFTLANQSLGFFLADSVAKVVLLADPEVDIGYHEKTDGYSIVKAGNTVKWQSWTVPDWIRSKASYIGAPNYGDRIDVYVNELTTEYSADAMRRQKSQRTNREPIRYWFPNPGRFSEIHLYYQFESLKKAKEILYLARYNNTDLLKLMIIDRSTWQEKPIRFEGGPSTNKKGLWRILRNQQNELLLEFEVFAQEGEVALWKFNTNTDTFELQVHETYDGSHEGVLGARIDYDTKQFIAWTVGDQLLVQMPVALDRKGVQP